MNQQSLFRYSHSDRTRVFRDMRKSPVPEISQEQCYFVGFRISIESSYRYHHALILADDHDSFVHGIRGEFNAILDQSPATYARDIALVFMRNLVMQDPAMIDSVDRCNIKTEIQKLLSKRDDNQFTVFGRLGESICLANANTSDALTAIQTARRKSAQLAGKNFRPLEVCQAHPVTKEFDTLFHTTSNRIMSLIGSVSAGDGHLH